MDVPVVIEIKILSWSFNMKLSRMNTQKNRRIQ